MITFSLTQNARRLPLLAGLVALFLTLLGPTSEAHAACAGAASAPSSMSSGQVRDTTLCLLNDERRSRGLSALRSNGRLALAAERHAEDMANREYFAHNSPDGGSFLDRIKRAAYVTGGERRWTVGENLAWGTGNRATPGEIVKAWMNSSGHRANILSKSFREIGFGLASKGPRTLYATEFGARR